MSAGTAVDGVNTAAQPRAAAERARLAYAWEEAIAWYDAALAGDSVTAAEAYALQEGRAFCYRRLGAPEQELRALQAMAQLAREVGNEGWELEALARQAVALDALRRLDESRAVIELLRHRAHEAGLPYYAARAQYARGLSHVTVGEFERGARACAAALDVFHKLGALKEEANCAYLIAYSASYTGQDGRPYAERVMAIAGKLDDRLLQARAHHVLGVVRDDEPMLKLTYHEKALAIYQEIRELRLVGGAMHNVGVFYFEHGLYKRAYALLMQAIENLRGAESFGSTILSRHLAAVAALGAGQAQEALALNEQALAEAAESGQHGVRSFATVARGLILTVMGQPDEGRRLIEKAMKMAKIPSGYAPSTMAWLAQACLAAGDTEAAVEHAEEALQWADEVPDPAYLTSVLWISAQALRAEAPRAHRGDAAEAHGVLARAFETVVAQAAKLYDRGLRRAYLANNFLFHVPQIVLAWAEAGGEAAAEAVERAMAQQGPPPEDVADPFKRLLAFSARLTARAPAQQAEAALPAFILEEFLELSGAERAFMALRAEGNEGAPQLVCAQGMAEGCEMQIFEAAAPLLDRALLARHAVLGQVEDDATADVPATARRRSVVVAPLVTPSRLMGALYADVREVFGPFTREDADLLTLLANQAAAALENAEWTQALEQRVAQRTAELAAANRQLEQQNAELAVINSVQRGLVARLDMQAIYELVGDQIREIFDAQTVGIGTFEGEPPVQRVHYLYEKGQRFAAQTRPVGPLGRRMRAERRSFLLETVEAFKAYDLRIVEGTEPALSGIFVPILRDGEVSGAITLQNLDREYAFTQDDVRLLETLAHTTSLALQNAQLFDETQRLLKEMKERNAALAVINRVQQGLAQQLDLHALIELVGEEILEILPSFSVGVALYDRDTNRMVTHFYYYGDRHYDVAPYEPSGFSALVLRTKEPVIVNNDLLRVVTEIGSSMLVDAAPPRSLAYLPIMAKEEVIGIIGILSEQEDVFDEATVRLLESLAASLSISLENARLFAETRAAQAAAEAANASKSAFLANVSHELRTPLTSILGFARIVQKRLEERIFPHVPADDARAQRTANQVVDNLRIVLSEGQRLTALINNVLDLEKIEAGRMEWHMAPLSLQEALAQAVQATSALVEGAGLALVEEVAADLPPVHGDRDRLVQVMINLISNAVKFTAEGHITCRARALDGEILVSVADTGVGIAPQELDAVFEKFRQVGDTLTDKPTGTGLGLSICKEIVEYHGGRIWAESTPGEGSTFHFTLPLDGAASPAAAGKTDVAAPGENR